MQLGFELGQLALGFGAGGGLGLHVSGVILLGKGRGGGVGCAMAGGEGGDGFGVGGGWEGGGRGEVWEGGGEDIGEARELEWLEGYCYLVVEGLLVLVEWLYCEM